ncbi:hypothetical protein B0H11DRAFT_2023463 [Mycena galericulata]|nr:hypothetical protein B0H11DRAFT_2023463 [Mycena galericulata]
MTSLLVGMIFAQQTSLSWSGIEQLLPNSECTTACYTLSLICWTALIKPSTLRPEIHVELWVADMLVRNLRGPLRNTPHPPAPIPMRKPSLTRGRSFSLPRGETD